MTALELITRSLKLAQVLGEGETPSAEQGADALATLNEILDDWNTESLTLYGTSNETYTAAANGTGIYTIGPGGDFVTDRPVRINGAYVTYQGITFPVGNITQDQFNDVTFKALTSILPRYLLYVSSFPLARITLWPIPQQALPLTLSMDLVLDPLTLVSTITYPPGWARALRATLASELCIEYGREPPQSLVDMAREGKADIKRANHQPTISSFDTALLPTPSGIAGFLSGL